MMKKYILIWCALAFLFSCNDPYQDKTFQAYEEYPTASYLDTRTEDFSMWVEILHFADMYNAINQASKTYTSFVPNNNAVSNYLQKMGVSSIEELSMDYIKQLIRYHIINSEITQKEFLLGGKLTTPTVSGDYLTVTFDNSNDSNSGLSSVVLNNEARVIELANETTNGLVYVLDAVLTPLTETLYDRLSENTNYSIFQQAIDLTGWNERLSRSTDTVYSELGEVSYIKRSFTMFVVNNSVFANNGISDINGLCNYIGAGTDYTNEENKLKEYVGYHLLSQTFLVEDLFSFENDSSVLWTTQAPNSVFTTSRVNGDYYINYSEGSDLGVKLIDDETDIPAKNGVMHEVDGLMVPMSPEPQTFVWDLCTYDDVESLVNAYGASNDLGNIYQTYQSTEYLISYQEDEISSYDWKSYSTISSWPKIGYMVTAAATGSTVNTYGAYLNDMLVVNLGYLGNVTMKTPVILKGKYRIELNYACAGSLSDFVNGGSKCRFSFDDMNQEVYIYDGAQAVVGIYAMTLFNEIEFNETAQHDFKLLLMDSRATTHSSYRLQLDYVKFVPISE